MKSGCDNPCVGAYFDKSSGLTTICIRGYEPDTSHCNPQKTTSSHDYSGIGLGQVGGDRYRITNPFNTKPSEFSVYSPLYTPQFQPYVRPEFVPYTQPFVQLDIPHYIPPNKELSTSEKKVLTIDFTKILHDLYPNDYLQHVDNWPSTLWGKQVLERGDFEAIEKFFITEFVDILHKRYPNDYPADFKDWNSKNSQWGKEVILTKNFKAIGKWLPAYKKEVLEQQTVLKNDFIEILHKVYPEDYPMNFKDWNNIWGKEVLERGDLQAIEKHLPSYKKQALEKEQNILFLVKDKSDVYLGGMSIGDYGVKLIIGNIANKITTLNLANNQIRDDGVKLLANSLAKGEMPNLKKLHLDGNKITDEGHGFLSKALEVVEQNINVVLKSIQNASKSVVQFAIKEMLHIAKSNGISTKEVLTNQETIEYCKKGIPNVVGNLGLGYFKCWTKLDKPIAIYEMDFQYVATALMVNIMNPAKKPVQVYCTIESTVFSVVDEEFANCLTGLDSELNND